MISFNDDLNFIIVAFKKTYNINYQELLKMPVKLFLIYLAELNEDTTMAKLMLYRSLDNNQLTKEQLALKNAYRIEGQDSRDEQFESFFNFMKRRIERGK
ncbi:Gp15 family bacteriophage protein [Mesomycoplasma lagogenitalium]|uniref:Gp15 family bacteriophage protein n=1 Tax=Mesomycoplasma lagogenitalium TaxID=171286 RepID=UPI002961EEBD|nr:Gp15 family bacteriophage protein [Mesomycoplasma lagogenitalium]